MRNKPIRATAAILLSAALTLGSAGIAEAVTVGVRGVLDGGRYVWMPKRRDIHRGDAVRWRAVNGNHNVRSRGANWTYFRNLPNGTSVTRTFTKLGRFRYYCTIHGTVANGVCSGMCGVIIVS